MEQIIFLAFANNNESPLPALQEEDTAIYNYFDQYTQGKTIKIHRDSNCTKKGIREKLIEKQEGIVLFHFSGHAGEEVLFLKDEPANADGLADFLGLSPNVKLIFLNGCSTYGHEQRLVELPSKPAVIFTTAPIKDQIAVIFAQSFYKAFCEKEKSIQDAFQIALVATNLEVEEDNTTRDTIKRKSEVEEEGFWMLSCQDEKLVNSSLSQILAEEQITYLVNETLTERLGEAYEEHSRNISDVYHADERTLENLQTVILEALPHPISEQLRKLFAIRLSSKQESKDDFFHEPSLNRLKQMIYAAFTLLDLVAYIFLSQLWNEIQQGKIKLKEKEQEELAKLFSWTIGEQKTDTDELAVVRLITKINAIFEAQSISKFMEEIDVEELFKDDEEFKMALKFLHTKNRAIQTNTLTESKAKFDCKEGEEKLAVIYGKLWCILNYEMDSVQSVSALSHRHINKDELKFAYKKIRLIQNLKPLEPPITREGKAVINTESIFIYHKKKETALNLTPFLMDENVFDSASNLAKICAIKSLEGYGFRHIYKPKEVLEIEALESKRKRKFAVIKDQIDKFAELVFNVK